MKISSVNPGAIDRADTTFRITFPDAIPQALTASIHHIGILHPVIVRKSKRNDHLQIITGFRRVQAAHVGTHRSIPAYVYTSGELTDKRAGEIVLYDNTAARTLNDMEKARVLDLLLNIGGYEESEIISLFLPALNLDPNRYMFERYIKLLSLPHSSQTALARERLLLASAEMILLFPSSERSPVQTLLNRIPAGKNKACEIISLLLDISKREKKTSQSIIGEKTIKEILTHKKLSGHERFHRIKQYLFERRNPTLSTIQASIRSLLKEIKLNHTLRLLPPPSLEGEGLSASFSLKHKKDIALLIKILKGLQNSPPVDKLLKML